MYHNARPFEWYFELRSITLLARLEKKTNTCPRVRKTWNPCTACTVAPKSYLEDRVDHVFVETFGVMPAVPLSAPQQTQLPQLFFFFFRERLRAFRGHHSK
jgi:hypothetical protein